nr:proteasome subunit beta type-5-like [Tanacetum cinerariifolium]
FDEYEKKSTQMVQPAKGTTSVAFIFEGDVMVIDDSRASMGSYICQMLKMAVRRFSYRLSECGKEGVSAKPKMDLIFKSREDVPVCGDSVQQECYRPLDMAASMDTHADVTNSEQSENSSSWNFSMTYDHTPPSIAVPQTFSSHEDRQIKSMAEEFDWVYCGKLRNRVVKEGDASSLLVTSSSNVIVASDDGISQEDPTHYANAGVPGSNICPHSQNTWIDIFEWVLHREVPRIIGASSSIMAKEQTHVGIFVIEHVDSGKSITTEKMEYKAWSIWDEKALVVQKEKTSAMGRIREGMGRQRTNGAHVIFILCRMAYWLLQTTANNILVVQKKP